MPSTQARNIGAYEQAYLSSDFEATQATMRKRMLLNLLQAWQPQRVLEVGCGTDPLFNHWPAFERWTVVEPGPRFAALAREQAGTDARIEVIEATLESAAGQIAAGRYDCILLSGLLHEIDDCGQLLAATRRLCGADTRVHVNVPNARSLHRLLAQEMGLIPSLHVISDRQRQLQQHHTFDLDSLQRLCTAHGFAVLDSGSYFIKPFTHQQMAQLQDIGLLSPALLDGLFRLERHLPGMGSEIFVNLQPGAATATEGACHG